MRLEEVIRRWAELRLRAKDRCTDTLAHAWQTCPGLLVQHRLDPQPMARAWGAIEADLEALAGRVSDLFDEQVEPALEAAEAPEAVVDRARERGLALQEWMERNRERCRVRIFAEAARTLWARAAVDATRRPLAESFAHYLAEEAAWEAWLARREQARAYHAKRDPSERDLEALEATEIAYWRIYLRARARWLPERAAAFEADLRGRMRHFYESHGFRGRQLRERSAARGSGAWVAGTAGRAPWRPHSEWR